MTSRSDSAKIEVAKTRKSDYRQPVMKLEEIAVVASKLSEEERASLASQLLHGLESPFYEVTETPFSPSQTGSPVYSPP